MVSSRTGASKTYCTKQGSRDDCFDEASRMVAGKYVAGKYVAKGMCSFWVRCRTRLSWRGSTEEAM